MPTHDFGTSVTNVDAATIAVLAYDLRVDLNVTEKVARASAWFDLGTALRSWLTKLPSSSAVGAKAEKLALSCMTSGLREDPANETYWMYLGDAHFTTQPKTAQHCYIRALDIDNKVSSTTFTTKLETYCSTECRALDTSRTALLAP